jgi:hypothetical protein
MGGWNAARDSKHAQRNPRGTEEEFRDRSRGQKRANDTSPTSAMYESTMRNHLIDYSSGLY